jgi:hypothetical protein
MLRLIGLLHRLPFVAPSLSARKCLNLVPRGDYDGAAVILERVQ